MANQFDKLEVLRNSLVSAVAATVLRRAHGVQDVPEAAIQMAMLDHLRFDLRKHEELTSRQTLRS